jgi:tetratricopeptide (TPR) repeat protein
MLAESAQVLIERKKWESAQKLVDRALQLDPDCVAALMTAGRCHLMVRRIDRAEDHFSKAISINPRTPVQKELGLLHLEAGRIPIAISLLTDHLQRNGADFEAYNLLIKCYFLSGRYEAGEKLSRHGARGDAGREERERLLRNQPLPLPSSKPRRTGRVVLRRGPPGERGPMPLPGLQHGAHQ